MEEEGCGVGTRVGTIGAEVGFGGGCRVGAVVLSSVEWALMSFVTNWSHLRTQVVVKTSGSPILWRS
jgi:hypothetical protein